jgi:phosphoglycerate dehydrogenase-like enzyme
MDEQPVLFVSALLWEQWGDALRAQGDFDVLLFHPGQRVSEADLERVTVACLSGDLWPEWSPAYMRCCLGIPHLDWFQSFSAGVDSPVFGLLLDRGTRLTSASGASATPIAHHVVMGLLALARRLPTMLHQQHEHRWQMHRLGDLEGRTVGVLGMGPIGLEAARLCAEFGMRPIGMRRTVQGDEPCETWTFTRLDELLSTVDDLVLALPLTPDTNGLIGARELALLRPGARLVNVGRGELIDEDALVDALRRGHLEGAALDVFITEPLPTEHPLWDLPNVIVTPHIAGATPLADDRAAAIFVDNLGRYLRGEPLRNEVFR